MNSKQLQRLLIFYSALGIFVIGVLVAILSIFPLYKQLRINEERNLKSALRTRRLAVEEFLSRTKDISAQIASRTQAKRELEAYNLGQNDRDNAVSNLTIILTDALNQTEDLAGITRLDRNNQPIVKVGLPIPKDLWKLPPPNYQEIQISDPIRLNNYTYFILTSPILNSNRQQIGTDLVLFKLNDLEKIISDHTGLGRTGEIFLATFENQNIKLFLSSKNENKSSFELVLKALEKQLISDKPGLTVLKDKFWNHAQVITFEPLEQENWGLIIKIDRQELYGSINHQLVTLGIVTIVFSLLGAGGMVFLLRPLAGRAIIQTDELERQLLEKTLTLRELNYTQEQLLLEIRDRKKAQDELQKRAEKLRNHNQVLMQLAQNRAINQGDLLTSLQAITEATAEILEVERVGVWLYDDSKTSLRCLDLYQKNFGKHGSEVEFKIRDYPAYFNALFSQDILAAPEAYTDPRTREFYENYLKPLEIVSLLDTTIWIGGEMVGILCVEKQNNIQNWSLEDEFFVRSIANLISLAIEACDRQKVEAMIAESESRFRTLVANIPGVIYRCNFDSAWTMQYLSEAVTEITGYPADDFINNKIRSFADIIFPEDLGLIQVLVCEAIARKTPYVLEYRIVRPDGSVRWLYEKGQAIFDENGEVRWLDGGIFDINDRKQAENALRKSEGELRQQKQQLQQTLQELQRTQTQMIQNEKMSSLGQMVAGIAHEINNPVNFIHGNLVHARDYTQDLLNLIELYQDHYPDPHPEIEAEIEAIELEFLQEDIKKLLKSMQVGTERIRDIVKSLRTFSRLDEAEIKEVDLHEGLESTLLILHHRLKSKPGYPEINVIKEYGKLPKINCYSGQINQVFMNIISNAIDAIEEAQSSLSSEEIHSNPGCICIKTEQISKDWVQISIADNGGGMTEDVRSCLFNPFFTTKPVGKGTGLGLSISYQVIVEKHKGRIECDSIPKKGTEFRILIPGR